MGSDESTNATSGDTSQKSTNPTGGSQATSSTQSPTITPSEAPPPPAFFPPSLPAPDGRVPKRLAEFEVVRRLGIGGMAEVFLARKRGAEGTYKLLVLKRILPENIASPRFRVMFAAEAQLATRLNHPNIVQVYDFQDYGDDGQLLSMEYVDGPDLRALGKAAGTKETRVAAPVATYIVSEVAKGLHYAHERKDERGEPLDIVHRDVSPQNVLLSYDGTVKIADFGIASANIFREDTGILKGKTGYMSPEQARGEKVDRRTDIYSLGVVLHELLTARRLHGDLEGDELLSAVRKGRVEPPSTYALGIPPELDKITLKALALDPKERYQTARELSNALARSLFSMGELVDSQSLEATIIDLIGERVPEKLLERDRSSESSKKEISELGTFDPQDGTPIQPLLAAREKGSEVRHVAVVSFALCNYESLIEELGVGAAKSALERLARTLEAIAFRRDLRLDWQLEGGFPVRARAVAGLMANRAAAAADAMLFVVDLRDGVNAARDDLNATFDASVGVVRSLATGRRNEVGHLHQHELADSANELADLLRDTAEPGISLVAGGLYRLVRRDFLWGDAPNVDLDPSLGQELPPRMRVYELIRALSRDEKREEIATAPDELIGRDAELADLHAAYYGAVGRSPAEGITTVRVVAGELGVGKTALINAFVNELPPDARVLRAECTQARQEVPYGVLTEWIRDFTGTFRDQPQAEAQQRVRTALDWPSEEDSSETVEKLAELCTGQLSAAYDEAEVAHQNLLLLAGFSQFVRRSVHSGPLVVVLDAMQWCDELSLKVINSFLLSEDRLPILVLLITRPGERVSHYTEGKIRVELGGLSPEDQARLLRARFGVGGPVEQICSDIFPRAAGNPYFLIEIVEALLERGVLELQENEKGEPILTRVTVAGSVITLPTTLEQLIADRLTELSAPEHELIDWLAVAGAPLSITDLQQLFGDETDRVLTRLEGRGMTAVVGGKADVNHPLTRDVAYRSMGADERAHHHRCLGELFASGSQSKGIQAASVARHLAKGGKTEQAVELYLEAGGAARATYQIALASRCYQKVAKALPLVDTRSIEAHEALESIARNEGRWSDRRTHLLKMREGALKSKSGYWVALGLLRTARYELDSGHLARAARLAHLSEESALYSGSEVIALQARSMLAEVLRDVGDMQGALAAVDRALSTSDHPDITARLRAEVLRARGTLLRRVGRVLEAVDAYAEAIAIFQRVGARRMEARARTSMSFAMYVLGRYEDGIALGKQASRIDSAIGGTFRTAKTIGNIGLCYAGSGDHVRALESLEQARDAHERYGERDSRADTLLAIAEVHLEQGEIEIAEAYVGDAAALIQVTESRYDATHEKLLRALLARAQGKPLEGVARATEARVSAETQAYASFQFYAMALEAISRVESGEHHTGILLATTAFGTIVALQGSEYSMEIRLLCCQTLELASSPQSTTMRESSEAFARQQADRIGDPELRQLFLQRPPVVAFLGQPSTDENISLSPSHSPAPV